MFIHVLSWLVMNNKVLHQFYLFVMIVDITMIIVVSMQLKYRKSIREKIYGRNVFLFMNCLISIKESCTDYLIYNWQNNDTQVDACNN